MFKALNAVIRAENLVSPVLRSIAGAAEDAGEEATGAGIRFGNFGSALNNTSDDAIEFAIGVHNAQDAVDGLGDEATESAIQLQGFTAALNHADRRASGFGAELGPLSGGVSSVGALAAAATPEVLGLSSALIGLGGAGGAAAAGIGALAFGGLQQRAERMAATSSKLADSGEAMQQIWENFGTEVREATAPLQTMANTDFAMSGLEGAVELIHKASTSIADLRGTLVPLAESFGATTLQTAPAAFEEIETTVRKLAPALEGLNSVVRATPDAIRYFREQAVKLSPALGDVGWSAINAAGSVGELGTTVLTYALPALSLALDGVNALASGFNALPQPLQAASVAMVAASIGAYTLAGGVGVLSAAVGVLTAEVTILAGALSAPVWAIAAVAGAAAGLIEVLGLWDDIANVASASARALARAWNWLVEAGEFLLNGLIALQPAFTMLAASVALVNPPLGVAIWAITHLGTVIGWVQDGVRLLGDLFEWLGKKAEDWLAPAAALVDDAASAIGDAADAVDQAGGVQLDAAKVNTGGNSGSTKGGSTPPPAASTTSASTTTDKPTVDKSTHNYDVTVNAQSENADAIADRVVKRLEKKRRMQSGQGTN
ncbi:hypothetical protein J2752_000457 [Halarchaeum rubridurum]|uniref:Phage-related protein n=1 Tax=Halarchaeum rubridurum TaxID=489911 RepID=A0A830FUS1_9EURY|nr:hypothetical protein [Halarchaeum rubridurum]MBP1953576.1 hypothetical protein [Halarchaeum rubridurum]GGM64267.1 hypothetical protein GCM10009017_12860 [Halarchaeum rubridurum]